MNRRGFTIVELIIVITVMAVLIALSTANLYSTQAQSRDTERREDIETIAAHLETYYTSGSDASTSAPGRYPSTQIANNLTAMHTYLRDADDDSLEAPGITDPTATFTVAANNSAQTPDKDHYIYQPLSSDGTLCTSDTTSVSPPPAQDCTHFILYAYMENDGSIYTVKSRNQ